MSVDLEFWRRVANHAKDRGMRNREYMIMTSPESVLRLLDELEESRIKDDLEGEKLWTK